MNISERNKILAIGVLLTALGFMGGFLVGGDRHSGPRHATATIEGRQPSRYQSMREIGYHRERTGTTVIVIQNGQTASASMQAVAAPPDSEKSPNEMWLFLLLASAAAPITWAALLWNRWRPGNHGREFVPRRDD